MPRVAAAIGTVQASKTTRVVKLAFEFLVLTAARSGEVRLATWDEIDRDGLVWTIPATRLKAKRAWFTPGIAPPVGRIPIVPLNMTRGG